MESNAVIVVTGAAGFIGSCMVSYLNQKGFENLILVDEFDEEEKDPNLFEKKFLVRVERDNFFEWLEKENPDIRFVFHLGARTDTTEFDYSIHDRLNVQYSIKIWQYCAAHHIPLVYASSAATYGAGELGYSDSHEVVGKLKPLNPYGVSKNEFDKWALNESALDGKGGSQPPFWAGLKFFNVYGPNEYHKARMASVIFHAFNQIQENGRVKLFRSHRPDFKDGEQLRDFVYVLDVVNVCWWLMDRWDKAAGKSPVMPGLYNLGTGKARTFKDLVTAIYKALNRAPDIEYIDMPLDIRDKYQYFTEADMGKLIAAGYTQPFYSLEDGVKDYVTKYLAGHNYF
jgi:ADP-L-glycero-D-manno-heptose 6-epimerase